MNVVHIKDSVCTLPTSILAQYLKQANGQLSSLKVRIVFTLKIIISKNLLSNSHLKAKFYCLRRIFFFSFMYERIHNSIYLYVVF